MPKIFTGKLCATIAVMGAVSLLSCSVAMAMTSDECKASAGVWQPLGSGEGNGYCYRTLLKQANADDGATI